MSAPLPDRYGVSKEDTSNHVVTNNFLISIGIVVGACGVAVMASSVVVKTGEFYFFANYALEMLRQTQFVVYVGFGSLVLGFLGILCGFLISLSGLLVSKYPRGVYVAMGFLALSAAGNIAAGAVVQNGIKLLNDAIYAQSNTPAPVGSFTQNVTHFQLSMFNACCASQGAAYSKEVFTSDSRAETKDPDGTVKFCDALHPVNLAAIVSEGNRRSCYKDQETYRQFNFSVGLNLPRICATLTGAQVNIAGKKVPGTSIDVTGLTGGDPVIPIVGPNAGPDYGCGVGYAKAFQAAMLIWAENILQPVATAFIACGAVYVVLLLLTFATFYACSRQGQETAEERYARYLEEINSSTGPKPAQVADNFEHANPGNRMSMNQPMTALQYSQRLSVQSHATHGSHSSQYGGQPAPAGYMQQQDINFNVDDKI